MATRSKSEILTFKVDESLRDAMRGIPNRSDFIRRAVIAALDNTCPVCQGTGVLSVDQRGHWDEFARNHIVQECGDCHEMHLVCRSRTRSGRSK
ncbi:MAG: CopG family transcriptional regulator [bacterium]